MSVILTKWWLFYKNSMRKVIFFIALVFSIVPLFAENASNVRVEQKGYRGDTVVITYDLSVKATIKLLMSTDMSNDFKELTKVVGDVGKELVAGSNYTIIWLPLLEYERFYADDVRFKVEAVTQSPLQVSTSQLTTSASAATGRMAGHEYVDLGLSVKWATCNIGASRPEDYGDYFAWGETRTKSDYSSWNTYKWCNGSETTLTKYKGSNTQLESSDDAAHVKWGGRWRMPTRAEQDELRKNCTWQWTTQNGVNGYKVTGRNGNSIFLPAAGSMMYRLWKAGDQGCYWSSNTHNEGQYQMYGYILKFGSEKAAQWGFGLRYEGAPIRPVCAFTTSTTASTTASTPLQVSKSQISVSSTGVTEYITVTCGKSWEIQYPSATMYSATRSGNSVKVVIHANTTTDDRADFFYIRTTDESEKVKISLAQSGKSSSSSTATTYSYNSSSSQYEYVDMGLSVKWATCNIGASRPEDYGDYFAWGETRTKSDYSWNTYKWGSGEYSLSKYITQSKYGRVDNKTILESSDDAARVKWGAPWRMPTMEEMEELCNNCTWKWTTQNGVKGYRVTARNGNSIFLPAGGNMFSNSQFDTNEGWYWLRSLTTGSYPDCAYNMKFTSGQKGDTHYCTRTRGCNIRPVCP